jgi:hypothetical protein
MTLIRDGHRIGFWKGGFSISFQWKSYLTDEPYFAFSIWLGNHHHLTIRSKSTWDTTL